MAFDFAPAYAEASAGGGGRGDHNILVEPFVARESGLLRVNPEGVGTQKARIQT